MWPLDRNYVIDCELDKTRNERFISEKCDLESTSSSSDKWHLSGTFHKVSKNTFKIKMCQVFSV